MRWNSFSLIKESFGRSKGLLSSFKFKDWFKLGIISVIAGFNFGSGFRYTNSVNSYKELGSEFLSGVRTSFVNHAGIYSALFFLFVLFGLAMSFFQSIFTFIFVDGLVEKKARFSFHKNYSNGKSFFFVKLIICLISLVFAVAVFSPYIYNFIIGNSVWESVPNFYFFVSIGIFLLYSVLLYFTFLILNDFTIPYVYSKNCSVWSGFKHSLKKISENKSSTLVYWISRILIGIVIVLIFLLVFAVVFALALLIAIGIFALFNYLYGLVGHLWLFVSIGIILGIVVLLALILGFILLILPVSIFVRYFALLNSQKLFGIKILK